MITRAYVCKEDLRNIIHSDMDMPPLTTGELILLENVINKLPAISLNEFRKEICNTIDKYNVSLLNEINRIYRNYLDVT